MMVMMTMFMMVMMGMTILTMMMMKSEGKCYSLSGQWCYKRSPRNNDRKLAHSEKEKKIKNATFPQRKRKNIHGLCLWLLNGIEIGHNEGFCRQHGMNGIWKHVSLFFQTRSYVTWQTWGPTEWESDHFSLPTRGHNWPLRCLDISPKTPKWVELCSWDVMKIL